MTSPLEQYADFYVAELDAYDLDAYAVAVTLDQLGIPSKAYRLLVEGDIAVMESYNDEHNHDTAERARAWLARFERGIGLPALIVSWVVGMILVAVVLG